MTVLGNAQMIKIVMLEMFEKQSLLLYIIFSDFINIVSRSNQYLFILHFYGWLLILPTKTFYDESHLLNYYFISILIKSMLITQLARNILL